MGRASGERLESISRPAACGGGEARRGVRLSPQVLARASGSTELQFTEQGRTQGREVCWIQLHLKASQLFPGEDGS